MNRNFRNGILNHDSLGLLTDTAYQDYCYDSLNFDFNFAGSANYRKGSICIGHLGGEIIRIYSYDQDLLIFRKDAEGVYQYAVFRGNDYVRNEALDIRWKSLLSDHSISHMVPFNEGILLITGDGRIITIIKYDQGVWSDEVESGINIGVAYPVNNIISGTFYDGRLALMSISEVGFSTTGDWKDFTPVTQNPGSSFLITPNFGIGGEQFRWIWGAKEGCYIGTSSQVAKISTGNQAPITPLNAVSRLISDTAVSIDQPILFKNALFYINDLRNKIFAIFHNQYSEEVVIGTINITFPLQNIRQLTFRSGGFTEHLSFLAEDPAGDDYLWRLNIPQSNRFDVEIGSISFSKHLVHYTYKLIAATTAAFFYVDMKEMINREDNFGSPYSPVDYPIYLDSALHFANIITDGVSITNLLDAISVQFTLTDPNTLVDKFFLIKYNKINELELEGLSVEEILGGVVLRCRLVNYAFNTDSIPTFFQTDRYWLGTSNLTWNPMEQHVVPESRDPIGQIRSSAEPYREITVIDRGKVVERKLNPDIEGNITLKHPVYDAIFGLEYRGFLLGLPSFALNQQQEVEFEDMSLWKQKVFLFDSVAPLIKRIKYDNVNNSLVTEDVDSAQTTDPIRDKYLGIVSLPFYEIPGNQFSGIYIQALYPAACKVLGYVESIN